MEVYPLVVDKVSGKYRQAGLGDEIAVLSKSIQYKNLISDEPTDMIKKCSAVYLSSEGKVRLANANAPATSLVRGLAIKPASPSSQVAIQSVGDLTASKTEWDEILGVDINAVGYVPVGLEFGKEYFLNTVNGQLTKTPPSSSTNTIVYLGIADDSLSLDLDIDRGIYLT